MKAGDKVMKIDDGKGVTAGECVRDTGIPDVPASPRSSGIPAWGEDSPWVAWFSVLEAGAVIWGLAVFVLVMALCR